ncbi:NDR1/HIN1-like protein 2 [Silene latifolia]|uniref:NDR1/HIN1-like protein 2 n=1 Tax=Silene latifolia TaxID=37657 RepID=UPI003D777003
MHHQSHGLPIHGPENNLKPYLSRPHTARYYAHRVRESLSTRISKFICTIFLFIFCLVGLIAFILWLSLRPHKPRFFIEDFTMLTLAQPNVSPQNAQVHFNVTIRNPNQKVEVHYDSISCSLYYKNQQIGGAPIQTEAFDQGFKNSTIILKDFVGFTISNQLWTSMQQDRTIGTVTLRLQLNSVLKFEIFSKWDTKRHKLHANCNVILGPNGVLLDNYRDKKCPVYFT